MDDRWRMTYKIKELDVRRQIWYDGEHTEI